jgi:hypothetical protein
MRGILAYVNKCAVLNGEVSRLSKGHNDAEMYVDDANSNGTDHRRHALFFAAIVTT